MIMIGYVQVYTGDGKGKTTAAMGLALRAAGAGLRVFIAQFVKSEKYSEIIALERLSDLFSLRDPGLTRSEKSFPPAGTTLSSLTRPILPLTSAYCRRTT
jgi:cob(I)alamin adenosyltransferase